MNIARSAQSLRVRLDRGAVLYRLGLARTAKCVEKRVLSNGIDGATIVCHVVGLQGLLGDLTL